MESKSTLSLVLVVSCALGIHSAFAATEQPAPKPTAPQPIPNPAEVLSKAPHAVFTLPTSPRDGKNPFFPRSTEFQPRPAEVVKVKQVDPSSSLVLNGITGPPRPSVMINGYTLEKGETGEIKVGTGKVIIKCEDIGTDSATILVNNTRKEFKLRQRQ